jgi:UDP-N-acetylmuramoylalanine--D-glutamate ligase
MADSLNNKKVLVVGFGRQGRALARWLPTVGASVVVNDSRTAQDLKFNRSDYPGIQFILGRHPNSALKGIDLICVSGGVPLDLPMLQKAVSNEIPLTNDAQLFLERCPAPVIGITGSAGKTTTTLLVGEIIKQAGYTTWVGGNTGDVLLDNLKDIDKEHIVVMELSSFQLELMESSPHIAAILNITPNHLDRHKSMERYIAAKANIMRYQRGGITILNMDDSNASRLSDNVQGELVEFSMRQMVTNGAFMAGERLVLIGAASFDYVPHVLLGRDEIPLLGEHNVYNVLAACAIAGSLGLAIDRPGIAPETIADAVRSFKPVPHRLESVRTLNDVLYVNDSIATAPERLIAAINSFKQPLVLLIGGADKDLSWDAAVSLALRKSRHIVVFGRSGRRQVSDKVMRLLRLMGANERVVTQVGTLDEAVQRAHEVAEAGDVVLLSPGGTSYDAYKDFAARGDHFRRLVEAL